MAKQKETVQATIGASGAHDNSMPSVLETESRVTALENALMELSRSYEKLDAEGREKDKTITLLQDKMGGLRRNLENGKWQMERGLRAWIPCGPRRVCLAHVAFYEKHAVCIGIVFYAASGCELGQMLPPDDMAETKERERWRDRTLEQLDRMLGVETDD